MDGSSLDSSIGSRDADASSGNDAAAAHDGDVGADASALCERHTVRGNRVAPDMLVVLDKSGSMNPNGNAEKIDRWSGSVQGVEAVTSSLEASIRFGLMTFPALSSDVCAAGMLDVPLDIMNAAKIKQALDGMKADGSTPTAITLAAAHTALKSAGPGQQPQYVMLVTDGSPNCGESSNPVTCLTSPDPQACLQMQTNAIDNAQVDASVDEIKRMAQEGIKTYVVGFGTKNVANLKSALDKMAVAGATGDTQHRAVEDKASLVTAFEEIAKGTIGCSYELDATVSADARVAVSVDQTPLVFNAADGWTLSSDNRTVIVQGSACATLRDGQDHSLVLEVFCAP